MAVLIFKPLEKCNSNCLYCDTIVKQNNTVMSYDLLEKTFFRIGEYLTENKDADITLVWHGGEISLLKPEYFERAALFFDKYCGDVRARVSQKMQSNLTLLKPEHIHEFLKLGITSIGTSFDPIPHIRGFGAKRDSDIYNKKFFEGVSLLERFNIKWGIIYTTHRRSLDNPKDILNYLVNLNPYVAPLFNFVRSYGDEKETFSITDEEYGHFLGEIFSICWEKKERYGDVQPFSWYINTIINNRRDLVCDMAGHCANNWMSVGPDGNICHCGVASDYKLFNYGNILDCSIKDALHDPMRVDFSNRQNILKNGNCRECRFWGVCHGGCPVGAVKMNNDFFSPSTSCKSTKIFLSQYFEPLTGVSVNLRPL